MGTHEQCLGKTDEWYTPPYVFNAMGETFTMDVASPGDAITPWIPAIKFITEGSLEKRWDGLVWMNPPFGGRNGLIPWLEKFWCHGSGVCLVPDRTSAPWWQDYAPKMDLILFVAGKIQFIDAFGNPGKSPAQGTCLMSLGLGNDALRRAAAEGLGYLSMAAR